MTLLADLNKLVHCLINNLQFLIKKKLYEKEISSKLSFFEVSIYKKHGWACRLLIKKTNTKKLD